MAIRVYVIVCYLRGELDAHLFTDYYESRQAFNTARANCSGIHEWREKTIEVKR